MKVYFPYIIRVSNIEMEELLKIYKNSSKDFVVIYHTVSAGKMFLI